MKFNYASSGMIAAIIAALAWTLAAPANAQQADPGVRVGGPGMMQGYGGMGPGMMGNGSGYGPGMMQGYGGSRGSDAVSSAKNGDATTPDVESKEAPVANRIVVSVLPQALPGPDGKRHDAFMPSNFVLKAGVRATLVIVNYDEMAHSITAPDLGLSIVLPPAKKSGNGSLIPSTTAYSFTPAHKGYVRWFCTLPCDDEGHEWAMTPDFDGPSRDGYMAGYFAII